MFAKRLVLSIVLLGTVMAAACAPHAQPGDCARPEIFCVGLVTDFGSVDSGINHEAWLGLQDAKAAGLADRVDYIETVDVRDRKANIAALAADGYDVIVTVGYPLSTETAAAAKKYTKISFIGVEQPQTTKLPNVAGLVFHEEQSGFLAGAVASLMTETGRVAGVCDAKFVDSMRRYCDGFKAGALYANPQVAATLTYREGPTDKLFNDPNWGRAAALQQINDGADIVFAAGGNTGIAALEAAATNGAFVIGSETDLYPNFADLRHALLTSAVSNVRLGVLELVRQAHEGDFPPGDYTGTVGLASWHDLDRQIPSDVKEEVERIKIRLAVGGIDLGVPYKNVPQGPKATRTPRPTKTP